MRTDSMITVLCLAGLCTIGCSKSDSSVGTPAAAASPPQPVSTGGTTDPTHDWENAATIDDRRGFVEGKPESSKTLDQTTTWLRWALERYGHTHPTIYSDDLSSVRFRGCTMEWTERQTPDDKSSVVHVAHYSVFLRDLRLDRGDVQFNSEQVRFGTRDKTITVINDYFENGEAKPGNGTASKDNSVNLPIRTEDKIGARVASALFHAARLCGAPLPVER